MKYPRLYREFKSHHWAMDARQIETIKSILLSDSNEDIDYNLFHAKKQDELAAMSLLFGSPVDGSSYASKYSNIGIMTIYGPIVPRASWFDDISGAVSVSNLTRDFEILESDESIDAILMIYDSPGGAVTGISDFADKIKNSSKTVYSHVVGMAASAAYWLASQADLVLASDTSEIGSIGVVATIYDDSKALENQGVVTFDMMSAQTPRKRTDLTTEEGQKELQAILNDTADIFINAVARGRNTTYENVLKNYGEGASFIAGTAMKKNMIDGITTIDELITSLANGDLSQINESNQVPSTVAGKDDNLLEVEMTDKNDVAAAEETKKAVQVNAETKETAEQAIERIRSIEALGDKYSDYSEEVQTAAKKAIDAAKYQEGMTLEKAESLVMQAVLVAQNDLIKQSRDSGCKLASTLATIPDGSDTNVSQSKPEIDQEKVARMVKGFNNYKGKVE